MLQHHKGKIQNKLLTTDFKTLRNGEHYSSLSLQRKQGFPTCFAYVSNLEITLITLGDSWSFKKCVYSQTCRKASSY